MAPSVTPTLFIRLFSLSLQAAFSPFVAVCLSVNHSSPPSTPHVSLKAHPVLSAIITGKQLVQNNIGFLQCVEPVPLTRHNLLPAAPQAYVQGYHPPTTIPLHPLSAARPSPCPSSPGSASLGRLLLFLPLPLFVSSFYFFLICSNANFLRCGLELISCPEEGILRD